MRATALALLLCVPAAAVELPSPLDDSQTFAAMEGEMNRALRGLKQDSFGPPYFIAYRLIDTRRYNLTASYGSTLSESVSDGRNLFVEMRFGDKTLDNTDLSFNGMRGGAGRTPEVLRQNLWNLTDAAYKSALMGYLEKKAKRVTEHIPDVLDDFSEEKPVRDADAEPGPVFDEKKAKALAERLSAVFRRYSDVLDAKVSVSLNWGRRYLLTSEGTKIAGEDEHVPHSLRMMAMTRADDGMRLDANRNWPLRRFEDLPPEGELVAAAERMAELLAAAKKAPVQAPVAAPAILDPEVTGVLFHEALGHKLEGQRQRDSQQSQLFKDLVGKRVIPEFLSLHDDPTLESFKGEPMHGHYKYDSEGVPAQKVVLVEKGVLKSFLMSRWPVKGFSKSNGHGRADDYSRPTGRMANLIVKAENPVPLEELTKRLLALLKEQKKPYGFILSGSFGGENPNSRAAAQTLEVRPRMIYRVDAETGKRELVRGVSMVGTPLVVLNKIVAAGDDATLANGFVCGAESGHVPVSQIAPSVLLSEVELQRLPEDRSRPPILPSPFAEGKPGVVAH